MEVIRTQVYLYRQQHRRMRQEAQRLGVSLTELLRRVLNDFLQNRERSSRGGLSSLTGLGSSHLRDGSLRHDFYVADAISERVHKKRKV